MRNNFERVFRKLSAFGVLEREQVKNDLKVIRSLLRRGYVEKVYKKGRVFYELSERTLPWLDERRKILLHRARLKGYFHPRQSDLYRALIEDVRFLDITKKDVQEFQFLSDWRLNQRPVKSQLLLSQLRYYQKRGLE